MRLLPTAAVAFLLACDATRGSQPPLQQQQSPLVTSALHELVARTPLVAKVTVLKATVRRGTMGARGEEAHFTDATVRLDLVVRGGEAGTTALLSTLGGELDGRAMHVSGEVALGAGDELIVFADPAASPHPFTGGREGILRVRGGLVSSYDGRALVAISPEGFTFAEDPRERPVITGLGTASGRADPAPAGPALTVSDVLEALKR